MSAAGATVDFDAIESAAERLRGIAVETPLFGCPELDDVAGGTVLLKAECLQRTGSFKIRGAYNLMSRLGRDERARGVVAWSSGNHAQGVAAAGRLLGVRTAVVMPCDAPRAKLENTRRLGGEPVLYDRKSGNRERIARALAAERGAGLVPSYDHPDIIAGQGTVGLEIMRQSVATPDQVLIPCSGGGLASGCATAIRALSAAGTAVYSVEPAACDDTARSLAAGARRQNSAGARTICDALQVASPGEMTFEIMKRLLAGGLTVSDEQVRVAMRFAFRHLKLVLEPGGAVALAAVLCGRIDCRDRLTVVVLSGGNVDPGLFAAIQRQATGESGADS